MALFCPLASKTVSFEQAEAKRQKAVDFLNRIGDSDAAADFDTMSTQEYIDHRGLKITNNPRRRMNCMPQSKADLEGILDNVQDILETAYTPESSREDLVAAVSDALDQLAGPEEEDEDEDIDEDDADSDNGD
jgi:hypothetical protein